MIDCRRGREAPPRLVNGLAPRERQCLLWSARGKTYSEISLITGLAYGTVKSHLDGARFKLNCAILPAATAMAVARGLITLDDLMRRD
jgi:LuxR family transcriptional activator of conjugal transfer of Ti plasmids